MVVQGICEVFNDISEIEWISLMIRMNHTYRLSQKKRNKKIKKIMDGTTNHKGCEKEAEK